MKQTAAYIGGMMSNPKGLVYRGGVSAQASDPDFSSGNLVFKGADCEQVCHTVFDTRAANPAWYLSFMRCTNASLSNTQWVALGPFDGASMRKERIWQTANSADIINYHIALCMGIAFVPHFQYIPPVRTA